MRRAPRSGKTLRRSPSSLSPTSIKAVDRFVRILSRCGAKPADLVAAVQTAAARVPAKWTRQAQRVSHEIAGAAHVLTVWFSEADFLDPLGKPRALPFEGRSRSFVALVRRADRRFAARELLEYLLRCDAVRRKGSCYVPRDRALFIRGAHGPDYFHTLRVMSNMLANLDHNSQLRRTDHGWFEYFAENRQFPARARRALDKYVAVLGKELLFRLDAYMRRREVGRRPGERTMHVGVGMHLWEAGQGVQRPGGSPRRTRPK